MGRWMSPDPYNGSMDLSNPQSFNRYSYVGNNPLGSIDTLGLQSGEPQSASNCSICNVFAAIVVDAFDSLFSHQSSFHGSLKARPTVEQPTDDNGMYTMHVFYSVLQYVSPISGGFNFGNGSAQSERINATPPSCWALGAQHVLNAVVGTLDASPSPSTAAAEITGTAASIASQNTYISAEQYAATAINAKGGVGLIVAGRSSIYRDIMAQSADLARVAASGVLVGLDVNLGIEIYDEIANPKPCR